MAHTIIKGSELVLRDERAPDAPDEIYSAECMTCQSASGEVDDDPKPAAMWVLEHTAQNGLTHDRFLITTYRHWQVGRVRPAYGPASSAGYSESIALSEKPTPRVGHARPRDPSLRLWVMRELAALFGPFAGPLVVGLLVTGFLLLGILVGTSRSPQ